MSLWLAGGHSEWMLRLVVYVRISSCHEHDDVIVELVVRS